MKTKATLSDAALKRWALARQDRKAVIRRLDELVLKAEASKLFL